MRNMGWFAWFQLKSLFLLLALSQHYVLDFHQLQRDHLAISRNLEKFSYALLFLLIKYCRKRPVLKYNSLILFNFLQSRYLVSANWIVCWSRCRCGLVWANKFYCSVSCPVHPSFRHAFDQCLDHKSCVHWLQYPVNQVNDLAGISHTVI